MDYVIGVDIGTQSTKALLVAADDKSVIDNAAVEQGWIRLDERPRPEVHARYEKQFKLYCDLYPSLKHVTHGLQESAA